MSVRVPLAELNISAFPPVLRNWVIKGLGMSSRVCATGHIKDPGPLIEKRGGLSPGGRFPPGFIHRVMIITGLNKLHNCRLRCRLGVKPLLKPLYPHRTSGHVALVVYMSISSIKGRCCYMWQRKHLCLSVTATPSGNQW